MRLQWQAAGKMLLRSFVLRVFGTVMMSGILVAFWPMLDVDVDVDLDADGSQRDSPRSLVSSAFWCCHCILWFGLSFSDDVMTPVATDHSNCSLSLLSSLEASLSE